MEHQRVRLQPGLHQYPLLEEEREADLSPLSVHSHPSTPWDPGQPSTDRPCSPKTPPSLYPYSRGRSWRGRRRWAGRTGDSLSGRVPGFRDHYTVAESWNWDRENLLSIDGDPPQRTPRRPRPGRGFEGRGPVRGPESPLNVPWDKCPHTRGVERHVHTRRLTPSGRSRLEG